MKPFSDLGPGGAFEAPRRHDSARTTRLPALRPGQSYAVAKLEEEIRILDTPSARPRCASPWCSRAPLASGTCFLCGGTEVRDGR